MLNTVTAIGTKVSSLEEVRRVFRSGRAMEALHSLRSFDSVEAAILRARVLSRLERNADARRECLRFSAGSDTLPVALLAESLLVFANVEFSSGRLSQASALLDEARLFVVSSASAALEAEFLYLEMRVAHAGGNVDVARERARAVLDVFEPFDLPQRSMPMVSLGTSKARAHELLGFLRLAAGDLRGHLSHMSDALATIAADSLADSRVYASLLANFASAVRETDPSSANRTRILEHAAAFEWSAEMARFRFSVYDSLGWIAALEGDHLGAMRAFREASRASNAPEVILQTHVARAYLAQELGQVLLAAEEIAEALEITNSIDWQNPPGESFVILAMLAQLVAVNDPATAQSLMELYRSARGATDSSRFATTLEPRMRALEIFALAKIALALGKREEAVAKLAEAHEIWSGVGCAWRAGLAASELARLEGGESFVELARAEAESRPRSFFAKKHASLQRLAS